MGYRRLIQHGRDVSDIPASVDIFWGDDDSFGPFAMVFHAGDNTPNFERGERIVIDNANSDFPDGFTYTAVVKDSDSKTGYANVKSLYSYPLLICIQDALEDLGVFDN